MTHDVQTQRNIEFPRRRQRRFRDLTGSVFGKLTVVSRAEDYVNPKGARLLRWNCVCECGKTTVVRGTALTSGHTVSCGCERSASLRGSGLIDLTGKRFGRWLVESRADDIREPRGRLVPAWNCLCDCGNRSVVRGSSLRKGDSCSCGCLKIDNLSIDYDLRQQRFGRLTVVERAADEYMYDRRNKMWLCSCDCGKMYTTREADLLNGSVSSCGCISRSRSEVLVQGILDSIGVSYNTEVSYDGLVGVGGRSLRYDVCIHLPMGDVLIELQGIQHYEPSEYFGTKAYDACVEHDTRKRDYAAAIGVPLHAVDCSNRPGESELIGLMRDIFYKHGCGRYFDWQINRFELPAFTGTPRNMSWIVKHYQFNEFCKNELGTWERNEIYHGLYLRDYLFKNRMQYLKKTPDELTDAEILRGLRICGAVKGYTAFDASLMNEVLHKYDIQSVYDPCAGWGERMLCCFKNGVSYHGNDINNTLSYGYRDMIHDLGMKNCSIEFENAFLYVPQGEYDAVITCPPYGDIEQYTDVGAETLSADEFIKWWKQVVRNCASLGVKYFCFQINIRWYEAMRDVVEGEGFVFVDELVYSAKNKSSHFTRKGGHDAKKEYERMLVFERR